MVKCHDVCNGHIRATGSQRRFPLSAGLRDLAKAKVQRAAFHEVQVRPQGGPFLRRKAGDDFVRLFQKQRHNIGKIVRPDFLPKVIHPFPVYHFASPDAPAATLVRQR